MREPQVRQDEQLPRGLSEPDAAGRVAQRVMVPLGECLGPAELGDGVEMRGEFGVRHGVHLGTGLPGRPAQQSGNVAREGAAVCEADGGGHAEVPVLFARRMPQHLLRQSP